MIGPASRSVYPGLSLVIASVRALDHGVANARKIPDIENNNSAYSAKSAKFPDHLRWPAGSRPVEAGFARICRLNAKVGQPGAGPRCSNQ
jgi:alcohol dehydrogenase class IV